MSYGRNPYYIFGTQSQIQFYSPAVGSEDFPYEHCPLLGGTGMHFAGVPYDAMAQFIAQLASRGTKELQSWIDRGNALNENWSEFLQHHEANMGDEEREEEAEWQEYKKVTVIVRDTKGRKRS